MLFAAGWPLAAPGSRPGRARAPAGRRSTPCDGMWRPASGLGRPAPSRWTGRTAGGAAGRSAAGIAAGRGRGPGVPCSRLRLCRLAGTRPVAVPLVPLPAIAGTDPGPAGPASRFRSAAGTEVCVRSYVVHRRSVPLRPPLPRGGPIERQPGSRHKGPIRGQAHHTRTERPAPTERWLRPLPAKPRGRVRPHPTPAPEGPPGRRRDAERGARTQTQKGKTPEHEARRRRPTRRRRRQH